MGDDTDADSRVSSSPSRVTVFLMRFFAPGLRHGYMLPVVSKEKTTSMGVVSATFSSVLS